MGLFQKNRIPVDTTVAVKGKHGIYHPKTYRYSPSLHFAELVEQINFLNFLCDESVTMGRQTDLEE